MQSYFLILLVVLLIGGYMSHRRLDLSRFKRHVRGITPPALNDEDADRSPTLDLPSLFKQKHLHVLEKKHPSLLVRQLCFEIFRINTELAVAVSWHDLKTNPNDLPIEGTSVLCYVPAWEDYVVAYVFYEDDAVGWRMDGDSLTQANWPSRWQTIADPSP